MNDTMTTVQQLRDAELALEDELTKARRDLATRQDRAGEAELTAVLHGGTSEAGAAVAKAAQRVDNLVVAIREARARRREAITAAWQAEAAEVRTQAAAKRAEADKHEQRTADLLRQLKEHEGANYVPAYREVLAGRSSTVAAAPVTITIPRSESLRNQAAHMEQRARAFAARQIQTHGTITAGSRDELLASVRGWDPWTLAPALHAVTAWLDEPEAAAREHIDRQAKQYGDELRQRASLRYTVAWRDGELDARQSAVRVHVAEPAPVRITGSGGRHVTYGTSRQVA